MCTFQDDHSVLVCDVAIYHVRMAIDAAFGNGVQYTTVEGQGTLVEATPTIDTEKFHRLTRTAIVEAQNTPTVLPDQKPNVLDNHWRSEYYLD